ncbi:hypothetical protein ACIA98_35990 [Streptomyces sp. NPDC051366]
MHRRERLTLGLGAAAVLPTTPAATAGVAAPGQAPGRCCFAQHTGAVV